MVLQLKKHTQNNDCHIGSTILYIKQKEKLVVYYSTNSYLYRR
jgi:hypothetical protein